MPTIRIDDEVYAWLQSQAVPFDDNPNSVLRRVAGLDPSKVIERKSTASSNLVEGVETQNMRTTATTIVGRRTLSGRHLNSLWDVNAHHALYHRGGTFFENLHRFPGALFDPNGYVVFQTEQEYNTCPYLNLGPKLNVPGGIASMPRYKLMR